MSKYGCPKCGCETATHKRLVNFHSSPGNDFTLPWRMEENVLSREWFKERFTCCNCGEHFNAPQEVEKMITIYHAGETIALEACLEICDECRFEDYTPGVEFRCTFFDKQLTQANGGDILRCAKCLAAEVKK